MQPANRVHFPALDGIRAGAFLLVFFQHYLLLPWGWSGVNIFFVLSGFLITGILMDTRDTPYRVRNFYTRRTLRIFPLYYGIFLVLLALTPLLHWQWSASWIAWPLYLGNLLRFIPGTSGTTQQFAADGQLHGIFILYLTPLWSLCIEEQFYLVWPWFVFFSRSVKALLWICAGTVLVIPLLRCLAADFAPVWMLNRALLYYATPFQVDSLLLGGLLAILWRGSHRELLLSVAQFVAAACTIVTALYLVFVVHIFKLQGFYGYSYPTWRLTWGLTFINIYAGALILCAIRPGSIAYRIFHVRPLRWMGGISYGAYMFHDLFHDLYFKGAVSASKHVPSFAAHPLQLSLIFALAGTLLLAHLSYRFFETPFLKLKDRYTKA